MNQSLHNRPVRSTSPPPPYNEALESVNEEPPTYNETITQIREKLPKLSRSISVSAHKFGRQMSVKRVSTITEQGWHNESLSIVLKETKGTRTFV